jgi:hypothetical protein
VRKNAAVASDAHFSSDAWWQSYAWLMAVLTGVWCLEMKNDLQCKHTLTCLVLWYFIVTCSGCGCWLIDNKNFSLLCALSFHFEDPGLLCNKSHLFFQTLTANSMITPPETKVDFEIPSWKCSLLFFKFREQISTKRWKCFWLSSITEVLTYPELYTVTTVGSCPSCPRNLGERFCHREWYLQDEHLFNLSS